VVIGFIGTLLLLIVIVLVLAAIGAITVLRKVL
jgi:hypothetical protein